jgi:predicted Zn-dependent peptidase
MTRPALLRVVFAPAFALGVLIAGACGAHAALAPYRPPTPVVRTLPNGVTVAVFPDHRLPIVQAALLVPAGSAQEAPREVGIASLTAACLSRGTASRSADDFDLELQRHGATLNASAGREYATVSLGLPASEFEAGLELMTEAALNPGFADEEIDAARTRLLQQITAGRQNIGTIADDHAIALAFAGAAGHPISGTFETLPDLHRAEVQSFHRRCYRPDRALLGVAGDVDPEKVFALAQRLFSSWSGQAPATGAARHATGKGTRVRIVDLPNRAQAEFRYVFPVPGRADSTAATTQVLVALLESGRDARGGLLPRDEQARVTALGGAGLLVVSGNAPVDSVASRVQSIRTALAGLAERPIDAATLAAARRRMVDGYALSFESLAGVIGQWMTARTVGLRDDEPARYSDRMAAVDARAVSAVTAAAVANEAVLVVVGPASRLSSRLAGLGDVEVVSGNASPVAVPAAPSRIMAGPTATESAEGKRLIAAAVTAHGGAAKLAEIKDSVVEADVTLAFEGQQLSGTLKETRKDPDRYLAAMMVRTNLGQQGLEGGRGWVYASAMGDTVLPADSATVASLRAALGSDVVHLLRFASDPAARVAARGRENVVPERPADVVEVVDALGMRRVLFLDPASHRVVGVEQAEGTFGANLPVRRLFADLRQVSGLWWPFSEVRSVRGERLMTIQARSVRLNTGVTDGTFSPPGRGVGKPAPAATPRIRR